MSTWEIANRETEGLSRFFRIMEDKQSDSGRNECPAVPGS